MSDATARVDAEEVKEEEKKADAEAVTVDKLLKKLDEVCSKMDAYEKEEKERADAMRRKDGQTEGADFSKEGVSKLDDDRRRDDRRKDDDDDRRKDARRKDEEEDKKREDARRKDEKEEEERRDARRKDEDKEEEARRDRRRRSDDDDRRRDSRRKDDDDDRRSDARSDSVTVSKTQFDAMMRDMEALKSKLPKPLSDADWHEMHAIQSRADAVYGAFGANNRAPRPMDGETPPNYRRRLAEGLKKHSTLWKDIDLYVAVNDAALTNVELAIYNDAMQIARNPANLGEGELRENRRTLESGHKVSDFYGKPSAWLNQFAGNRRMLAGVRTKNVN
jgi:hypothetical protein